MNDRTHMTRTTQFGVTFYTPSPSLRMVPLPSVPFPLCFLRKAPAQRAQSSAERGAARTRNATCSAQSCSASSVDLKACDSTNAQRIRKKYCRQILKFSASSARKANVQRIACAPTSAQDRSFILFWKNGKVKVKLAIGKGKVQHDKREDLKRRDSDKELKRAMMHRFKGK